MVKISMTPAGSHFIPAYQIDTPEPSQTFGFLRVHLTCPQVCGQVSNLFRSLSGNAPKGPDASCMHEDLQLDNACNVSTVGGNVA